ncbi:MAG: protocatechuate 3,4-dioxygenase beta subunit [Limisphaerales bacterium]
MQRYSDVRNAIQDELTVRLQPGITIGGVVRDEAGIPQSGIHVRVSGIESYSFAMNTSGQEKVKATQYASHFNPTSAPDAVTDDSGQWEVRNFPANVTGATVELLRPNGSITRYRPTTAPIPGRYPGFSFNRPGYANLDFGRLRARTAEFALPPGITIRGKVVGPDGAPLANVLVKEGYGLGYGSSPRKQFGSFRTDTAGRFTLRNRRASQIILTAEADGFAIISAVIDAKENTPEAIIRMQPRQPLHMKILDREGRGIAGAIVRTVPSTEKAELLDWEATTDAQGEIVWTNAPRSDLALAALAPDSSRSGPLAMDQKIFAGASERDLTFRLGKEVDRELLIRGRAIDADTGKPVLIRKVFFSAGYGDPFTEVRTPDASTFELPVTSDKFRPASSGAYNLKIIADEQYETHFTPARNFYQSDWTAEFAMKRGPNGRGRPGGTVVDADGQPLAKASVSVANRKYVSLKMTHPGDATSRLAKIMVTDSKGEFEFNDTGEDTVTLITHEYGFLATRADHFKRHPRVVLQPWGRVEGQLLKGVKPAPEARIGLKGGNSRGDRWSFDYATTTDHEGRFVFEKVPPGACRLYRPQLPKRAGVAAESWQRTVTVDAGRTAVIVYGGKGRPITGRVTGDADLTVDVHLLSLKLAGSAPEFPNADDFATRSDRTKGIEDFFRRPWAEHESARRDYRLNFEADGSFRIDDVPAGDYELHIAVTEPKNGKAGYNPYAQLTAIAWLNQDVVVPEMPGGRSDEPLDLGTLKLQWKNPPKKPVSTAPKQAKIPERGVISIPKAGAPTPNLAAIQNGSADQPPTEPRKEAGHQMKLTVTDSQTSWGVAGAEIRFEVSSTEGERKVWEGKTDANGQCDIPLPDFPFNAFLINGARTNYANFYNFYPAGGGAKNYKRFSIKLNPGARLGGIVQDDKGAPIPGADVTVNLPQSRLIGEMMTLNVADFKRRTDADGTWRWNEAPPNLPALSFTASHPDYAAVRVPLSASPAGTNFVTALKSGFTFHRQIANSQGLPIPNATVLIKQLHEVIHVTKIAADSDGRFKLTLPSNHVIQVTIDAEGYSPRSARLEHRGELEGDLQYQLDKGNPIRARVVDPDGNPVIGANIFLKPQGPNDFPPPIWNGKTDKDGRFIWNNAPTNGASFDFYQQEYKHLRKVFLTPGPDEVALTMLPSVPIRGKAINANTGSPITFVSVHIGEKPELTNAPVKWLGPWHKNSRDGTFTYSLRDPDATYLMKVTARGFEDSVSEPFTPPPDHPIEFRLKPTVRTNALR